MKKLQRGLNMDTVKILKGQDLGYVTMKANSSRVDLDTRYVTSPDNRLQLHRGRDNVR